MTNKLPSVKSGLYRLFTLSESEQDLLNHHFDERMTLPVDLRKKYQVPRKTFSGNWRLAAAWGFMVTYADQPGWLIFTFLSPVLLLIVLIQAWR